MILSKLYMFFFFLASFFFFSQFNSLFFCSLVGFFNFSFLEKTTFFLMGMDYSSVPGMFMAMVSLITSLVFLYSEFYMEFYNNKKFVLLTFSFFLFMIFLASSGSMMNLMIGWDGLGVSSLVLIMFYPNKITLFNSFLTFFFNRMGDVFFVIFFSYYLNYHTSFFHLSMVDSLLFIFFFWCCLLTKSAQMPFSSWLPAAMSAPTPISAMVHSSTLVTAGLYVFLKFSILLSNTLINSLMLFVSLLTFLLGGLLSMLELDLKKIVAFSTMSQISLILFFMSLSFWLVGLVHIFSHALFKTLLFVGCGVSFVFKNSDQLLLSLKGNSNSFSFSILLLVSAFSMSGMPFSSSFFTKDFILESLLESSSTFLFVTLISGSFLTIIYSSNIFHSISWNSVKNFSAMKNFQFIFLIFFLLLPILFGKLFPSFIFEVQNSLISWTEVLMINILIISSSMLKVNIPNLSFLTTELMFMKTFMTTSMSKFYPKIFMEKSLTDSFFFKPSMIGPMKLEMSTVSNKYWILMFLVTLLMWFF